MHKDTNTSTRSKLLTPYSKPRTIFKPLHATGYIQLFCSKDNVSNPIKPAIRDTPSRALLFLEDPTCRQRAQEQLNIYEHSFGDVLFSV
jgi:hypothetical protein